MLQDAIIIEKKSEKEPQEIKEIISVDKLDLCASV